MDMNTHYHFKLSNPDKKLFISIKQTDTKGIVLTATQSGKKRDLNLKQLLLNFFGYPLMTAKIISAIHYEAFILWIKGAIYRSRKRKIKIGLSYEGKKMNLSKIAEKFVLNKLKLIKHGNLKLVNYDGKVFQFGNFENALSADIQIINPVFFRNIVLGGSSALGEAHIQKDFYTSNLTNLIELTAKNIKLVYTFSGSLKLQTIKNFINKLFASNTKSNSLNFISKHYDLGNDFFAHWLDDTLTYSSAVYENDDYDLKLAQENKYKKLIDLLDIKDGNKVLEIGCGWGGFSEYLAKRKNILIDCITISKKQYEYSKKRIYNSGLDNRVNVKF